MKPGDIIIVNSPGHELDGVVGQILTITEGWDVTPGSAEIRTSVGSPVHKFPTNHLDIKPRKA